VINGNPTTFFNINLARLYNLFVYDWSGQVYFLTNIWFM